jgi:hypothetical protein
MSYQELPEVPGTFTGTSVRYGGAVLTALQPKVPRVPIYIRELIRELSTLLFLSFLAGK